MPLRGSKTYLESILMGRGDKLYPRKENAKKHAYFGSTRVWVKIAGRN